MKHLAIAVSRFNHSISKALLDGCLKTLYAEGLVDNDIDTYWVPGAYELPLLAQALAKTKRYRGIICLGAVIRGATPHFDYICEQTSKGLMRVSLKEHLPVIFGVLTTDTLEQAQERSSMVVGNKGVDSALCALEMINLLNSLEG